MKFHVKEPNPIISINGVEVDVKALENGSVTLEEWKAARGNTDGFQALHSKLDNEALTHVTKHYLDNCRYEVSNSTYDWAIKHDIIPELLKRLGEKQ